MLEQLVSASPIPICYTKLKARLWRKDYQIPVLVEPVADHGFRAKTGEPLPATAKGATPEEAVRNLRTALDRQLKNGTHLTSVDVVSENPWLALAGTHDPNDPLIHEWKQEIAAYRQEIEDDPDRPILRAD
jgi:hypothetical protein